MHGTPVANRLLLEADVLLAVGTRFSDRSCANNSSFCKEAKIIHADIDAAEIEKNLEVHVPIVGDAKTTLAAMYETVCKRLKKREKYNMGKKG